MGTTTTTTTTKHTAQQLAPAAPIKHDLCGSAHERHQLRSPAYAWPWRGGWGVELASYKSRKRPSLPTTKPDRIVLWAGRISLAAVVNLLCPDPSRNAAASHLGNRNTSQKGVMRNRRCARVK